MKLPIILEGLQGADHLGYSIIPSYHNGMLIVPGMILGLKRLPVVYNRLKESFKPIYQYRPPIMPLESRVDVLIIGAGPAGVMCANALAMAGTDVRIVDKRYGSCSMFLPSCERSSAHLLQPCQGRGRSSGWYSAKDDRSVAGRLLLTSSITSRTFAIELWTR